MSLTCEGCSQVYEMPEGARTDESSCPRCGRPSTRISADAPTWKAPPATGSEPALPARIDKYDILERIGTGGMGIVHKARDTELGRTVAIKVMIAGEHAGEETLLRFQREARSAASLRHPNIVAVYDAGRAGPLHYIVMELVDGCTVDRFADREGFGSRDAARIVRDIARALEYAHRQGIVHRDIKPGNILVDREGCAKLADFGLAKWEGEAGTLTKSGDIVGTPSFMSPEQAAGDNKAVDARTDVYSSGAVLYRLLTGRAPFAGGNPLAILKEVERCEPVLPTRLSGSVPKELEAICLKAMARDRGRRYASAAELAEDLDRFLTGKPVRARPGGGTYRATRWVRSHPALVAAAAVALLGAGIVAAVLVRAGRHAASPPSPADATVPVEAPVQILRRRTTSSASPDFVRAVVRIRVEAGVLSGATKGEADFNGNDFPLEYSFGKRITPIPGGFHIPGTPKEGKSSGDTLKVTFRDERDPIEVDATFELPVPEPELWLVVRRGERVRLPPAEAEILRARTAPEVANREPPHFRAEQGFVYKVITVRVEWTVLLRGLRPGGTQFDYKFRPEEYRLLDASGTVVRHATGFGGKDLAFWTGGGSYTLDEVTGRFKDDGRDRVEFDIVFEVSSTGDPSASLQVLDETVLRLPPAYRD